MTISTYDDHYLDLQEIMTNEDQHSLIALWIDGEQRLFNVENEQGKLILTEQPRK